MKKYKLILYDNYYVYKDLDAYGSFIGEFYDNVNKKRILSIIYMRDLYKRSGKHIGIFTNSSGVNIYISPMFMEEYKDKLDLFEALMFHELGHYINKDVYKEDFNKRNNYLLNGKVDLMEIKADAFAVSNLNKEIMIKALNNMIMERIKKDDVFSNIFIKELKERLKIINKL